MKVTVIVFITLLLAACLQEQNKVPDPGEQIIGGQTQVVYWTFRAQDQALWQRVNRENWLPGVEVKTVLKNNDDYEYALMEAFYNGSGPDFFAGKLGSNLLKQYVDPQYLASMESLNISLNSMIPASLAAVRQADGQLYGVPYSGQLLSIVYNKAAMESLGLDKPTNLEQFTALLKAAKA